VSGPPARPQTDRSVLARPQTTRAARSADRAGDAPPEAARVRPPIGVLALGDALVRALVEAAPDAIVVADPDGRMVLVNRRTEELFGYGRAELVGQPVDGLVPGHRRDAHAGRRAAYAADPRTRAMGAGLELAGRRKDGTTFPVEISLAPLAVAGETLVVATVRDVTARKSAEEALRAGQRRLADLEELAGSVAGAATIGDLAHAIAGKGARAVGAASAVLAVLAADDAALELVGAPSVPVPLGVDAPIAEAARTGEPVWVASTGAWAERYPDPVGADAPANRGATAYLPLRIHGATLGVLGLRWATARELGSDGHVVLTLLAQHCAQALERVRLREAGARAHAEAEAHRERAVAILDSTADGFFGVDGAWRFTYVNREAERLLGRPRAELVGRAVWDEATGLASGLFNEQLRWAAERRIAVAFEHHGPGDAWLDVRAHPTADGMSVHLRDVTTRKRAEEELRASEERFRLLFEGARDHAIFLLDADGRVASWNAGARTLKGYDEAEVLGRHLSLFFPAEDVRRGVPDEALRRAAAEGRSEAEGWRIRKDGSRLWASGVLTALHDSHGGVRGFAKVTRDLTDRHKAQQERERLLAAERRARAEAEASLEREHRARADAEAALAARDQILADLAHDLLQPLTAVQNAADTIELLAGPGRSDPDALGHAAAMVRGTAGRMARWIGELNDVARVRAGHELPLDRRATDLAALARPLVDEYQWATDRHRIRLAAPSTAVVGAWDRARLERVVDNLLGNAVKFSPDGGDIAVELEAAEPRGWAVLRVRDAGLGIPPAELPRLFELYHRASNVVGRIPGAGLGLAIARAIVERHGGTVAVESRQGVGSTFTVRLPLDEPPPGAGRSPTGPGADLVAPG
jgi:PAS domain S-box-containing protein